MTNTMNRYIFNRSGQQSGFLFSYLSKFFVDLFNISGPLPSWRDFSLHFWLITLAFICLPAVLMRFILWLFYVVSLWLVRKSIVFQMVVVLQGWFIQPATHSSLLASVWFTRPHCLRLFKHSKNTPRTQNRVCKPGQSQTLISWITRVLSQKKWDIFHQKFPIQAALSKCASSIYPPLHSPAAGSGWESRAIQSKCIPTTQHCWLENWSIQQERFFFPLQKPISGLQYIWKIWHYGINFLFSAIANLVQQRVVLSQTYTRKDKFKN